MSTERKRLVDMFCLAAQHLDFFPLSKEFPQVMAKEQTELSSP